MKKVLLGLVLVLFLQACAEKIGIDSMKDTKWVLTEWPGETMPNTTKQATLNFGANNSVGGKSFCNGFGGSVTMDGNSIKFSELMGTMMFCEDVGQAESKYTEGLRTTNAFKIVDGKLQLFNGDKLLMVFSKAD
jgi:heat shock protein HslJ